MRFRPGLLVFLALSGCPETAETDGGGGSGAASTNTGGAGASGGGGSPSTGGAPTGGSGGSGAEGAGGSGASGAAGGAGGEGPGGSGGSGGAGGEGNTERVRIVAANLTTGNFQSYDLGHGTRILAGLDADIVLLQEFNFGSNSSSALNALVDDICDGASCEWSRGLPQSTGIPNGVISRYPILESGSWDDDEVADRDFAYARIDVPGPVDLWAISVHLLSSSAAKRAAQASSLVSLMNQLPNGDYVVLGGDFNTNTRTENAVMTLGDFLSVGPLFPVDQDLNGNTNGPREKPYDWVLADPLLDDRAMPTLIGGNSFPSGAVIDTRVFTPLSAIAPAMLNDSAGPSMQHMAVVRDFALPL